MRTLARDCFVDGDKELVDDESLFLFGLINYVGLFLAVGRVSEDHHRINFTELPLFFQFESFFLDFSFLFQ